MDLFGHPNSTILYGWQPEPRTRGTWSIISSCLATMTLCIWTSLHLNMPRGQDKMHNMVLRKMGWLICGLFAPELVAWTAFQQFRDARALTRKMNSLLGSEVVPKRARPWYTRAPSTGSANGSEDAELQDVGANSTPDHLSHTYRRYPWTNVHSHYVMMGGFGFSAQSRGAKFMPAYVDRLVLTARGAIYLAAMEPDLLPDLPVEQILDKSKADGLAKTIVCLQASWFCLQCVVRMSWGIGISLLELNTFAHAMCALIIFLLWWSKPLDVEQPTIIEGNNSPERAAAMIATDAVESSRNSWKLASKDESDRGSPSRLTGKATLHIRFKRYSNEDNTALIDSAVEPGDQTILAAVLECCTPAATQKKPIAYDLIVNIADLLPYCAKRSMKAMLAASKNAPEPIMMNRDGPHRGFFLTSKITMEPHVSKVEESECNIALSSADTAFLYMAHAGLRLPHEDAPKAVWKKDSRQRYNTLLCDRPNEWPKLGYADNYGVYLHSNSILVGFTLAGLIYGGMHLLAWVAPFRTHVETVMWRGSCLVLACSGPLLLLSVLCGGKDSNVHLAAIVYLVFMLLALFYVLARVFLVAECFIELFHLPEEVFQMPNWLRYWPHLV